MFKEIEGDLFKYTEEGMFDIIAHGCNCFCTMGAGIAVEMAKRFRANEYTLEQDEYKGDINKLGTIEYHKHWVGESKLIVVNCYTQYKYGINHIDGDTKPLDYEALTLCMRKINHVFKGKSIGLPLIGCHLAGGDWNIVKPLLQKELKDMDVAIVHFKP